jgi:site-specific DNA recombinase
MKMRGRRICGTVGGERKVYGYCRVSTEEQAKNGVSLAAQEERIRAFCTATGRVLSEVIVDDGVSASSLKRDGLQRILREIRAGLVEAVVVLKLDRLTRSVRDLSDLLELFTKHETALLSVQETLDTSSATGRMVINLICTVSQWEREATGERTAMALAHLRRSGKAYGPVPFGWQRIGDQLVPDVEQQRGLALARRLSAEGASFRQIAAALTEAGIRPKRGVVWHANSVRSVLSSRAAVGAP